MTTIQFWTNEPTILLDKEFIFELWPTTNMMYEQKLNAITRLIILISILGFISTGSLRILVICAITLALIFIMYTTRKSKITKDMVEKTEGFEVQGDSSNKEKTITNPVTLESIISSDFKEGNKINPFSNVLLTDINDDPERKAAPPCFNPEVDSKITKDVKKSIQYMNPGIDNTNKQLFGDLWEKFQLDQSNRVFYSTANTRVVNDQGAYAKYLYDDMKYSGKESTPEGAFARVQDNHRYNLY
jgi:hypothetical protein